MCLTCVNSIIVSRSISGILLLKPDQRCKNVTKFFRTIEYQSIYEKTKLDIVTGAPEFNNKLFGKLSRYTKKLVKKQFQYRERYQSKLMKLKKNRSPIEKKILDAFLHVSPETCKPVKRRISEIDHCSAYLQPFVRSLLQEPNNNPRNSDLVVDELEEIEESCRPDYKCTVYEGGRYLYTNAYGEVKPQRCQDNQKLFFDLYKLALYAKDMIFSTKLQSVLCFHVWGKNTTCYLVRLGCNNICTMTEFCSINIPTNVEEMSFSLTDLNDLMMFAHIYKHHCFEQEEENNDDRAPLLARSLPLSTLYDIIEDTGTSKDKSNKRPRCTEI